MALDDTDIPTSCYEAIVEPFRVIHIITLTGLIFVESGSCVLK